ncbi:hypothetical protein Tco_1179458, partial [Tanacetum coccineum]
MADLKFAETHNLVVFLSKPEESDGFEQIIDFLNANPINYALTVNPTIYTSCIKQFWATAKAKTVNGEVQIQALEDGKKVIVTEASVRRDLQLADENGTECLPNATIFAELKRIGYAKLTQKLTFYKAFFALLIHTILQCLGAKTTAWNEFSSTMASAVISFATNQKFNFFKYIFDNMVKNLEGKDFSDRDTPLFPTMTVQDQEQVAESLEIPTDSHHTYTTTQKTTSKPQKKQFRRKQRKDTQDPQLSGPTEPVTDDTENVASVPTHSNDPLLSGEDRLRLTELMELCTNLSERVLALETTKTNQALKIDSLKRRLKKLEKKKGSRTHRLGRLYKGRYGDNLMFDTGVLDNEQDMAEKEVDMAEKDVSTVDPVTTAGEVVTTDSTTTTTIDDITLAQTLIEIKAAKPKAVTTAATTTTTAVTRPKARGVVVQEPSE